MFFITNICKITNRRNGCLHEFVVQLLRRPVPIPHTLPDINKRKTKSIIRTTESIMQPLIRGPSLSIFAKQKHSHEKFIIHLQTKLTLFPVSFTLSFYILFRNRRLLILRLLPEQSRQHARFQNICPGTRRLAGTLGLANGSTGFATGRSTGSPRRIARPRKRLDAADSSIDGSLQGQSHFGN